MALLLDPTDTFELRPLVAFTDFDSCVEVQREVWGAHFTDVIPPAVLKVVHEVGGIALGAFTPGAVLAGFVFGFSGFRGGRPVHWSDTLAVRPRYRDRRLGERIKRCQRDLLLADGIDLALWTFDPLESRNAYLNFSRLGATATEYMRQYYAETNSPMHQGIGTDRLLVRWELESGRVRRRLAEVEGPPTHGEIATLPLVNPPRWTEYGPAASEPELELTAQRLRLAIPADIQELKARAPELAAGWRSTTRAAFEHYLGRGYEVRELVREGRFSSYLLERML